MSSIPTTTPTVTTHSDLAITYPPELPISERHDELLAAISANQVVIVAGETGSGKSTQLPKLCLELGRGRDALIGHTQPRRLAARTIAERVASELDTAVGDTVGYTVRFTDQVGPNTRLKLMTDGILLAEMTRDRSLRRYDTLIIDEAHERSLNIDFILGYLSQLLRRRADLKVIITSATIDTERFSRHFDDAPVVEVSGRTYPVEVRYHPLDGSGSGQGLGTGSDRTGTVDQAEGIAAAVRTLWREQPGDILVFCSGEREIRDATDTIGDLKLPDTEVLPLFARMPSGDQHRIFQAHSKRRVVVSTNVAETSVTVPGVRSVVDVGTARISRYSARTKVQRLPIEPISQASANQRAGRCGRIGPGVCIRLYSKDDFDTRPEFTEPEIQRTNLASVILQMASLGLGDIHRFPFIDRPDSRNITDGLDLLYELDALDPDQQGTRRWLTPIGRKLAKLPIDPRYGRMLIDADANSCLDEVMVIAAGLSVQDPRERPSDNRQAADDAHRRYADPSSDFISYLRLWDHVSTERRARTRNQFRRMCRREFLNYHRVVEWQDIHAQLRQVTRELGLRSRKHGANGSGRPDHDLDARTTRDAIHQSILAGLLSHLGVKDTRDTGRSLPKKGRSRPKRQLAEYSGARNARFAIAPGSALFSKPPSWVMAAELVETSRLWARQVARIDPAWAEPLAEHLTTYSYGEPWWDAERGAALVAERVSLYGLTLVANRPVQLSSVDPALARELFIHYALVEGEWQTTHTFLARNRELIADLEGLEARARRRDLLVENRAVFDFYDSRIPAEVTSATHFDSWWANEGRHAPELLSLTDDVLLNPDADPLDPEAFPESWSAAGHELELVYEFDPHSHLDGVSVLVPIDVLNQLDPAPFRWSVPGFRAELVEALIRALPKSARRQFVPATETAAELVPALDPSQGDLVAVVAGLLSQRAAISIPVESFDLSKVPGHLLPTFRVINDRFELLAEGKDLDQLRRQLATQVRSALSQLVATDSRWERAGIRTWDFGLVPRVVETGRARAYPAIVDEGDSVAIRLLPSEAEQIDAMWLGVRRLLRFGVPGPVRQLDAMLHTSTKLRLVNGHVQSKAEWYNDAISCALDEVIAAAGGPPWDEAGFVTLLDRARGELPDLLEALAAAMTDLIDTLDGIHQRLDRLGPASFELSLDDVRAHLDRLAYPGFLAGVGLARLSDINRYLQAINRRLDNLVKQPTYDLEALATCRRLDNELASLAQHRPWSPELEEVTWMLEELRVSMFAQSLGTSTKVSEKRVRRAINRLRAPAASA